MILGMANNDLINKFWELVEVLVPTMVDLTATQNGYPGSEYCSGLMFGMHGSSLLIRLAKAVLNVVDAASKLNPHSMSIAAFN